MRLRSTVDCIHRDYGVILAALRFLQFHDWPFASFLPLLVLNLQARHQSALLATPRPQLTALTGLSSSGSSVDKLLQIKRLSGTGPSLPVAADAAAPSELPEYLAHGCEEFDVNDMFLTEERAAQAIPFDKVVNGSLHYDEYHFYQVCTDLACLNTFLHSVFLFLKRRCVLRSTHTNMNSLLMWHHTLVRFT